MWHQLDLVLDRKIQESEREFYGLLGLVSIRFARLEAQYSELLRLLIHPEDHLMTETLTKDYNLYKTIEMVKKLGRMSNFSFDDINELEKIVSETKSIKNVRNIFVHGIWKIKQDEDGEVRATCKQWKITYSKVSTRQEWSRGYKTKSVNNEFLRKIALGLEDLSERIQKFIDKINNKPSDFNY